ncbi:hypothetical protein [Williamsia sp. 1135]|uniref:hypothetical protein n=1 Tax=Williamsia sp. 1135 TaxID=1889262 RepID=UPI0014398C40|nr:hypothetical protein [Williamsia sp. 1135]
MLADMYTDGIAARRQAIKSFADIDDEFAEIDHRTRDILERTEQLLAGLELDDRV